MLLPAKPLGEQPDADEQRHRADEGATTWDDEPESDYHQEDGDRNQQLGTPARVVDCLGDIVVRARDTLGLPNNHLLDVVDTHP